MPRKNRAIWGLTSPSTASSATRLNPDRIKLRLAYVDTFVLGSATTVDRVYNLNSLYDPDFTGAGHQPLGFDQWSALYNRYLVLSCKVKIVFAQGSTGSDTVVGYAGINGLSASGTAVQVREFIESPYSDFYVFGNSPGQPSKVFTAHLFPNKITGASKMKYESDDVYQATISANPSELICLHVFAQDASLSTNVTMTYTIRLEFECLMWDRTFLTSSITKSVSSSSSSAPRNSTANIGCTCLGAKHNSSQRSNVLLNNERSVGPVCVSKEDTLSWADLCEISDSQDKSTPSVGSQHSATVR